MFLNLGMSALEGVVELIILIIIFVIIIEATYYTTRFIGRFQNNQLKTSNFEVIEGFRISQGKHLAIVKIGSKYFALALGKDEITVITELSEDEIIHKDNNSQVFSTKDFSKYFSKFINKKDSNNENK